MPVGKPLLRCLTPLFAGLLLLSLNNARAHVTSATSAQVILRSGQVEIRILTNGEHWLARLSDHGAWLLGDTDTLMPPDLTEAQQQAFLQQLVGAQTRVRINGQTLAFDRVSVSGPGDSGDMEIVLLARHAFPQVEKLSLQFPASLGRVHLSVVQPRYQLVPPGKVADLSL